MPLTLENFLNNENIKADRFGMAAISYIFKAFGDNIRSKEYWPWGDKIDFPWEESNGFETDLTNANLCITQAKLRSHEEEHIEIKKNISNNIKELKKRLERINMGVKNVDTVTQNIVNTSTEYQEKGNNVH